MFRIAYLVFGKLLHQLWHFYATGQIVIVVNGQRLNSIIAIWSHCRQLTFQKVFLKKKCEDGMGTANCSCFLFLLVTWLQKFSTS